MEVLLLEEGGAHRRNRVNYIYKGAKKKEWDVEAIGSCSEKMYYRKPGGNPASERGEERRSGEDGEGVKPRTEETQFIQGGGTAAGGLRGLPGPALIITSLTKLRFGSLRAALGVKPKAGARSVRPQRAPAQTLV